MTAFFVAFQPIILILHFIIAVLLVGLILLQSGKGTDVASVFGGAGSQSMFGPRGAATLLSKLTTSFAVLFLVTSLALATASKYVARTSGGTESIVEQQLKKQPVEDKAKPEAQSQDTQAPDVKK